MRTLLVLSCVASSLCAQSVVSPTHFTNIEGNSGQNLPFPSSSLYRYQQVHDDLAGTSRTIRGMSFRRDGPNTAPIVAQAFIVNGWMSTAAKPAASMDTAFDGNHGTDKKQVLNNKVVNFPRSEFNLPMPAAFEFNLPFDTPFTYAGTAGLCWEVIIPSRAATASGSFDAVSGAGTNPGLLHQPFGTGCKATGATSTMTLSTTSSTSWATGTGQLNFSGTRAPANGLALVVIGIDNKSFSGVPLPLVIPGSDTSPSGACTIYTNLLTLVVALATGTGSIGPVAQPIPVTTDLAGGTVFTQIWAVDPNASLGIATSNAVASHCVAPFGAAPISRVSTTTIGSPTGTRTLESGLVTRFDL